MELNSLRKCVNRADEWLEAANSILVRKQTRKRTRKSRGRSTTADSGAADIIEEVVPDKPDRTLRDLYT